ncbi:MAG: ROK family transcriptional regulator [Pseudomonadota bacterium]
MEARIDSVGANAERARSHNRQVVLERIRTAGKIGRAEIARTSGLSTQAVSNIIADLQSEGLIADLGRRSGVRGLPAVQYGLDPQGGFAIGIEIRPDAVLAAVLDLCGTSIASTRAVLQGHSLSAVTDAVQRISREVIDLAGVPDTRVLGAGVVMPGPFEPTGLGGAPSDLAIWQDVAPADWFSDALGFPVIVENDANAGAVAELVAGVAKGRRSYAFLYFGTGLGLGMVQNGRLVTGAYGNAGEIGHIPVPTATGPKALETVVSRLSLQRDLVAAGVTADSSDALARAYAGREPAMMAWLDRAVEPLSAAVTIVENMLDPETIILGGAMPDTVLDHLIGSVVLAERSVSTRARRSGPRLMRGASGRMTATLGAAALVINRTFTPQIAAVS